MMQLMAKDQRLRRARSTLAVLISAFDFHTDSARSRRLAWAMPIEVFLSSLLEDITPLSLSYKKFDLRFSFLEPGGTHPPTLVPAARVPLRALVGSAF